MIVERDAETNVRTNDVFDGLRVDDPSHPQLAITTFDQIEKLVLRKEAQFGRERLLDVVSGIGEAERNAHVTDYRAFIRSNDWPNIERPSTEIEFLNEYGLSAAHYVRVGFEAFDYIGAGAPKDVSEVIRHRVLASEALRGQFGKRSPTGLDERLENLAQRLTIMLADLGVDDPDAASTILGTPSDSALSAEALMLMDLRDLVLEHSEPPTWSSLVSAASDSAAWRCLRRHCRWSISQLLIAYNANPLYLLNKQIAFASAQRARAQQEKTALLFELRQRLSYDGYLQLNGLINAIVNLNQMNLTLEPIYSFKGGPGLAHGAVIRLTRKTTEHVRHRIEDIDADKWRLLQEQL